MATTMSETPSHSLPAPDPFPGMPREREALVAYVNRLRPRGAPLVKGGPAWHDYLDGFGWRIDEWNIDVRPTTSGDMTVTWMPGDFGFAFELSVLSGDRQVVICHGDPWDLAV